MKKSLKILSVLLTACMLLSFMPAFSFAETIDTYAVYSYSKDKNYGTLIFCVGEKNGNTVNYTDGSFEGDAVYGGFLNGGQPWRDVADKITHVVFAHAVSPTSTANWFSGLKNLSVVNNLQKLKTDKLTTMDHMFENCSSLRSLDFTGFICDPEQKINMEKFFSGTNEITSLTLSEYFPLADTYVSGPPKNDTYTGVWVKQGDDEKTYETSDITALSGTKEIAGRWEWQTCASVMVPVTGITCTPTDAYIQVGEDYKILTAYEPENATNQTTHFSVCAGYEGVVSVAEDSGYVTGLAPGKYQILCTSGDATTYVGGTVTDSPAVAVYNEKEQSLTFCVGKIAEDGVKRDSGEFVPGDAFYTGFLNGGQPWSEHKKDIKSVTILDKIFLTSAKNWFSGCTALETVEGMHLLQNNLLTSMESMYSGCSALTSINLCITDHPIDASKIVSGCTSLSTIQIPKYFPFKDAGLTEASSTPPYTGFWVKTDDTSKTYTAKEIEALSGEYEISGTWTWEADGPTTPVTGSWAVYDNGTLTFCTGVRIGEVNSVTRTDKTVVSGEQVFAIPQVSQIPEWLSLSASITTVDFLDPIAPETTQEWFNQFRNLTTVTNINKLDTSNVVSMNGMFMGCASLSSLDLSGFDTAHVKDMCSMFFECESLTTLDLSSFNTAQVTNMRAMFDGCKKLASLNLSGFDTSLVTDMRAMFEDCSSLKTLDLSMFNTALVNDMEQMFKTCSSLKTLDLSKFNTARVTDMDNMFFECVSLTELDLSSFNTERVTDMDAMFAFDKSLTALNLSSFDTREVESAEIMFYGCTGLKTLDLSNFNTRNIEGFDGMFYGCTGLTELNLSNFNTRNAESFAGMFSNCTSLTSLDISDFTISTDAFMLGMFFNCSALAEIKLGSNFRFLTADDNHEFVEYFGPIYHAAFPDAPHDEPYTGYWVLKEDSTYRLTAAQMMSQYSGLIMAGTWVWEQKINLSSAVVTAEDQIYSGAALTPAVTVTLNGVTLKKDVDYEVRNYKNNVNVGSATIEISGIGNYTGSASGYFTVFAFDISNGEIILFTHAGNAGEEAYHVILGNTILKKDVDYTLTTREDTEKHLITVMAAGTGNYTGAVLGTFPIEVPEQPKIIDISDAKVTVEDQNYTGKAITPPVTVTINGETLVADRDYTVEYVNNTEPTAEAVVIIIGTGSYTGDIHKTFQIKKQADEDEKYLPGDVDGNGKVEAADARLALRAAVGIDDTKEGLDFSKKTNRCFLAADVTKDQVLLAEDARLILRAAVGLEALG